MSPDIRIQMMTLCDAASERDGLVGVLGAGVTRIRRPEFPAALAADLALILDIPAGLDISQVSMRLELRNALSGEAIAPALHMQADGDDEVFNDDGRATRISLPVVINMQEIKIPNEGVFRIELLLGEEPVGVIDLDAVRMIE